MDISPRFDVLKSLRNTRITSCIDNSDGVYKSLRLLATLSGVKIRIEHDISENSKSEDERVLLYSTGGDYELLFTSPERLKGFPLLGRVLEGRGVVDLEGNTRSLTGFDHFRTL